MKVRLVSCTRWPHWPGWAIALVLFWAALVGLTILLSQLQQRDVDLCLFHNVTGLSCPTCGATRSLTHLLHGQWGLALLHNPMLFTASLLCAAALLFRAITASKFALQLTPAERKTAWLLAVIGFLANWLWVIYYNR